MGKVTAALWHKGHPFQEESKATPPPFFSGVPLSLTH